jgi:hypothetical protein
MNYNDGLGWLLMNFIGPILLGLALAWGGYESYRRRRARGAPVDARQATPREAAVNAAYGQGEDKPTGSYILALGLPVLATFVLIAIVVVTHIGHGGGG